MSRKDSDDDTAHVGQLSRRDLIRRIAVGSAFVLPVVASFDISACGSSSAPVNASNVTAPALLFSSADRATFTVGEPFTFPIVVPDSSAVTVTHSGKLPGGIAFHSEP